MIKKFPQSKNIEIGDTVFYNNLFGYLEYPMIVIKIDGSILYVRYYDIEGRIHNIGRLEKELFVGVI